MEERKEYFRVKNTTAKRENGHKITSHCLARDDGDQPCHKHWQEKLYGVGVTALTTEEIPAGQYLIQNLKLAG